MSANGIIYTTRGGPSCQSFSLSGRRRKFDKRDNLFIHYLKVIRKLHPKYFVMENVKGILTKDKSKFKMAVMNEIRSIIDEDQVDNMLAYFNGVLSRTANDSFVFQGKRTTGGDKRKSETPQYTMVGNAVPPLMAKAIANKILEVIDTDGQPF